LSALLGRRFPVEVAQAFSDGVFVRLKPVGQEVRHRGQAAGADDDHTETPQSQNDSLGFAEVGHSV
jgi:hypothetical protein